MDKENDVKIDKYLSTDMSLAFSDKPGTCQHTLADFEWQDPKTSLLSAAYFPLTLTLTVICSFVWSGLTPKKPKSVEIWHLPKLEQNTRFDNGCCAKQYKMHYLNNYKCKDLQT